MGKKFDFLSPGIEMREVDQSFIPVGRDAEGPIIIGRMRQGPAMKPIKVRNLDDFISVFGAPIPGGTGDQGDIWRQGNTIGPTYAAYAAQAWLASEESPVIIVRLAGEEKSGASGGGKAGWKLDNSPNTSAGSNGSAYGFFLINSSSTTAMGTGSLAAVVYCNEGYLSLSGSTMSGSGVFGAAGGGDTRIAVDEANTLVRSSGTNREFKLNIYDSSSNLLETAHINFTRNSSKYLRSVLNTNPQLTNSRIVDSADLKTYWLGESFVREIDDNGDCSNTAATETYGILLPLASGSVNWGDRQQSAQEAKSGWVISQRATNQQKLFRLKALSVGEEIQRKYMIAVEDIKESNNPTVDAYGSFTITVRNMQGLSVEKYSNVNLNPASPDYISKRIGDQYMEWDETNRRYRTYGDFPNLSNLVYVELNATIADGGGQGLLPAGFYGPVRPVGFTLLDGSDGANTLGDTHEDGLNAVAAILADAIDTTGVAESDAFSITVPTSAGGDGVAHQLTFVADANAVAALSVATNWGVAIDVADTAAKQATAIINAINGTANAAVGYATNAVNSVLTAGTLGITAALTAGETTKITLTMIKAGAAGNVASVLAAVTGFENDLVLESAFAGGTGDDRGGVFVKGGASVPGVSANSHQFAVGPLSFSASFNFPKLALRGNGTEGGAPDPYRAYYGIRPKLSTTSTQNDPDYIDYLRGMPVGGTADSHAPGSDNDEFSFIFSLDDLIVDSSGNSVTYTSGSYSDTDSGTSVSYTSPNNTESNYNGTFGDLLDLNVRQFMMPMWGGTEGWDITEKEPVSNSLFGSTLAESTDYLQFTLNKAIDSVKDPEVVAANLLLAPGITKPIITNRLISTAEARKDVLAIIDLEGDYVPAQESKDSASTRLGSVTSTISNIKARNLNSSYACCFYPAVQIVDNISGGQYVWMPASVAGLGAMARSQAQSDVWFAPAGFNRGGLGSLGGSRGPAVVQARQRLDSKERDKLYEQNINPIATFPAEGVVIFGQKTLQAGQSALDRINVRRLLLLLKSKVAAVSRSLLFDNNVQSTWARFTGQVNPILSDIKSRFGLTDYKVILDETTTTPDLIDRNIMYAKIYIKPARAIEYIVVDFVITKTGADFV